MTIKAWIVAYADCSDFQLQDEAWSTDIICKAWHLELVMKAFLLYGEMIDMWPCRNSLAYKRVFQFNYLITKVYYE